MTNDHLWDAVGPTAADLRVLESVARHRRAFGALIPAGEHQITVRNRLLTVLDDMEECLCEEGRSAPALAESWKLVDELERRYWEAPAETSAPRDAEIGPISTREVEPAARPGVVDRGPTPVLPLVCLPPGGRTAISPRAA